VTLELRLVVSREDWDAYHAIREDVLWKARGHVGSYDRSHPDEHQEGNFPLLLVGDEVGSVGVVRVDLDPPLAWFRRVAVRPELQGRGYGRRMLELAGEFAKTRGCTQVRADVNPGAVDFYRKLGFQGAVGETVGPSVPMVRSL
jgi:GNAT superfamily N-acetyltransferase